MATLCDYCLFGENRSASSLRDALRAFWGELYRRDPEGVRNRVVVGAGVSRSVPKSFPVFVSSDGGWGHTHYRLDNDLWVFLGSPNRQTLEPTCQGFLRKLGRSRSDFVIYDFPEELMFPNNLLYAALVREFKQLQAAHEATREVLHEAAMASQQALAAVDVTSALSTKGPIGAFLRIRDEFMKIGADSPITS